MLQSDNYFEFYSSENGTPPVLKMNAPFTLRSSPTPTTSPSFLTEQIDLEGENNHYSDSEYSLVTEPILSVQFPPRKLRRVCQAKFENLLQ